MYTVNGFGLPICLQQLYDQSEEASFIAREIARCVSMQVAFKPSPAYADPAAQLVGSFSRYDRIKAAAVPMLDYSDFCILVRMNALSRAMEQGTRMARASV